MLVPFDAEAQEASPASDSEGARPPSEQPGATPWEAIVQHFARQMGSEEAGRARRAHLRFHLLAQSCAELGETSTRLAETGAGAWTRYAIPVAESAGFDELAGWKEVTGEDGGAAEGMESLDLETWTPALWAGRLKGPARASAVPGSRAAWGRWVEALTDSTLRASTQVRRDLYTGVPFLPMDLPTDVLSRRKIATTSQPPLQDRDALALRRAIKGDPDLAALVLPSFLFRLAVSTESATAAAALGAAIREHLDTFTVLEAETLLDGLHTLQRAWVEMAWSPGVAAAWPVPPKTWASVGRGGEGLAGCKNLCSDQTWRTIDNPSCWSSH